MELRRTTNGLIGIAVVLVFGLATTGCSTLGWQSEKPFVPEESGLYAVTGQGVQRLDGDHDWQVDTWEDRKGLAPDIRFVVARKALRNSGVPPEQLIRLRRMAWVRSRIDSQGNISPPREGRWHQTELLSLEVPVKVRPVASHPGVFRVIPSSSLDPGLYALTVGRGDSAVTGRFGIQWPSVDKRRYASTHCVDRYSEAKPFYRPCSAQVRVRPADGLQVYLVHPEASSDGKMHIEGVVANTSQDRRIVPSLEAELKNADGKVLKRWQFNVTEDAIKPGEFRKFTTTVDNPPKDVTQIDIHVMHVRTHGLKSDTETDGADGG